MSAKRRKRKRRKVSSYRKINEGRTILREVGDDMAAARLLGNLFKDDVGEAKDLHESFDIFAKKHNLTNENKKRR